jgi:hypothetical protein
VALIRFIQCLQEAAPPARLFCCAALDAELFGNA